MNVYPAKTEFLYLLPITNINQDLTIGDVFSIVCTSNNNKIALRAYSSVPNRPAGGIFHGKLIDM